jgi:electron transfer flavoprotein beta subunit
MRIVVPMKAVPDLVEELELTPDGTDIDREYLKFGVSEWDDQALEEALLIKESGSAEVIALALAEDPEIEQALFTALAKGADKAVRLTGVEPHDTHARASAIAAWLKDNPADLVITGVQATDDLDGQLATVLAARLGVPHVSVAASVTASGDGVSVRQEYSGGLAADLQVSLPAVIGLQAARQAPRYAPITKIRQMQQAGGIVDADVAAEEVAGGLRVRRMFFPESTSHAEMFEGSPDEVAAKIVDLLRSRGLVKG